MMRDAYTCDWCLEEIPSTRKTPPAELTLKNIPSGILETNLGGIPVTIKGDLRGQHLCLTCLRKIWDLRAPRGPAARDASPGGARTPRKTQRRRRKVPNPLKKF